MLARVASRCFSRPSARGVALRTSPAASRRIASLDALRPRPSCLISVARCTTSLKKVWSFDHHCRKPPEGGGRSTISFCMRRIHSSQSARAARVERSRMMPVFNSP